MIKILKQNTKIILVPVLAASLAVACGQSSEQAKKQPSTETKTIPVGKGPDALFPTPDERYLYVANVEDTFVSIIDTHSDSMVRTLDTVDYPWGFVRLGESHHVALTAGTRASI